MHFFNANTKPGPAEAKSIGAFRIKAMRKGHGEPLDIPFADVLWCMVLAHQRGEETVADKSWGNNEVILEGSTCNSEAQNDRS